MSAELAASRRRFFRRRPWERAAIAVIGAGVVMLMQPLSLMLYSYSFATILTGTVAYVIVSKFRD